MKPYNDYASYLKLKYGCKVYRIGLDAGFTCPNRDGTKGWEGCIYCNGDGARASYTDSKQSVKNQLSSRISSLRASRNAEKFIAYFQAFTSTYAPVESLKKIYDQILGFDEIVGISIGTRPDAVDPAKLKLISSYMPRYEAWIEYGLQSIHDRTLKKINRGHTFGDFAKALKLTKECGISTCAHIILGLPEETREDMVETAEMLGKLKVDAVKIHLLHILKGSALERLYDEGRVSLMDRNEYIETVCGFLENLSPHIIIQRLTGEGNRSNHIAPVWAMDKIGVIGEIDGCLKRRGSCQGRYYKMAIS
jgi:hypothetical protein